MKQREKDLIANLFDLFKCRTDAHASGFITDTGKVAYPPARDEQGNDIPLTEEVMYSHLKGDSILGVWPIFEDDLVRWVALDFDGDDAEDPIEMAFRQRNVLRESGIISYVEVSRSGKGAHVWVFLDKPMKARHIRTIIKHNLIEAETFDRMFPNQDSASTKGYGNLIAFPFSGLVSRDGNSMFIDDSREVISPYDFVEMARKNSTTYLESLLRQLEGSVTPLDAPVGIGQGQMPPRPLESLSGALKVLTFSRWVREVRQRMSSQNQEPEFYALCCQFAQLQEGEALAYEFGRLHPYSDERINQKWSRAVRENKPHTCQTLRDMGFDCDDDYVYGVKHPYELAKLSFEELMATRRGKAESFKEVLDNVIVQTKTRYKSGEEAGYSYGYEEVDKLTSLRDGNLIVIGARTGVGKTSLAVEVAANLSLRQDVPAYIASLEMASVEYGIKLISNIAAIDSSKIQEGKLDYKQWKNLLSAKKTIANIPIFIDDQTRSTDKLIDVFAGLIRTHGKGVIIIDYIELLQKKKGESSQSMTERVILELKGLAKILEVPVIALTNFNRKAESDIAEGLEPQDGWIRNSGMVEQTADVILYLLGKRGRGLLRRKIHIQKERFKGTAGTSVSLWFDGSISSMNVDPPKEILDYNDLKMSEGLF